MTTSDANHILGITDLCPAADCLVVRWSFDRRIFDSGDIEQVNDAADLLGWDVVENEDGDLELSAR